jgi:hypothetical protein
MAKKTKDSEKSKKLVTAEPIIMRTPEFRQIYATQAIGAFTPYDFRMLLFNIIRQPTNSPQPTIEAVAEIILTPRALKEFSVWMAKNVKDYEREHGEIKLPKKE